MGKESNYIYNSLSDKAKTLFKVCALNCFLVGLSTGVVISLFIALCA